ncbi:MAG TPA: AI-2E family transporter [Sedimenticola sp.]|nr:AI-2E family transporter [Sedimenticola sp.]
MANEPNPCPPEDESVFVSKALEAAIRIGLLAALVAWCFEIVRPFVIPIIWGIIIAVASYPMFHRLEQWLGGREVWAAVLFTLLALVVIIMPVVMLAGTAVQGAKLLSAEMSGGHLPIPPPPDSVSHWPIVGEQLKAFWSLASYNIEAALQEIEPQVKMVGKWLLSAAAGAGYGILEFVVAIVIAAFLMVHARSGRFVAHAIATRLAGSRGIGFANLAESTVRSVARGILGVALIQSLLAGLGFLVAGIPAAGVWALVCLLLGVVQIGILIVLIPMVIYLFNTADTTTAVLFLIWCIPVGLMDNILKPILLGRGVKVPMLIIFMGAIGGFLSAGIIGLFIGSVVLTLGFGLFMAWLREAPLPDGVDNPFPPPLAEPEANNHGGARV